jgi:hypothetical protein
MLIHTELKIFTYKIKAMKKKILGLAFVIAAFVSITSGCAVHDEYTHYDHRGINDRAH